MRCRRRVIPTVEQLARARFITLPDQSPYARLIIEKPIGHDLASAVQINDALAAVVRRAPDVPHRSLPWQGDRPEYSGAGFANSIFEPLFNRNYVDRPMQITVAEQEGVGTRAGYYEQAGALRDMVQNHLAGARARRYGAATCLTPPTSSATKLELLQSLRLLDDAAVDSCVVRGQYGEGTCGECKYRLQAGSWRGAGSTTETFVAMQLFVDNWRWAGVPFFLRTGKRRRRARAK